MSELLKTIDIRNVLLAINEENPERAFLLIAGFNKLQIEIESLEQEIKDLKETEFYCLRAIDHYQDLQEKLEQENKELREGLEKIANKISCWDGDIKRCIDFEECDCSQSFAKELLAKYPKDK